MTDSPFPTTVEAAGQTIHIRPTRYVDPYPVVRRIGDRDLYLGNCHAADVDHDDPAFDHVLSVSSDAYSQTTHHHPLTDGPGNEWRTFVAAVDTARRLHRTDGVTLVNCKAGISRSTTVIATTLAAVEGRRFYEGLTAVQRARPNAVPHPALCELGVFYLAARGIPKLA